jgi:hypothetical protein
VESDIKQPKGSVLGKIWNLRNGRAVFQSQADLYKGSIWETLATKVCDGIDKRIAELEKQQKRNNNGTGRKNHHRSIKRSI